MNKFRVIYEADDGYCGGSRPKYFNISPDDLDDEMSDADIKSLFWDMIQNDFEQNVTPFSKQEDEFVAWAQGVLKEKSYE